MNALICNGVVIDIVSDIFPIASYLQWVTCDSTTAIGDMYFNGVLMTSSKYQILSQLQELDSRSVRALRTNDTTLLTTLETQAAALRSQL